MGNISGYTFKFDIHKNELESDCSLRPSEVLKSEWPWLYAENNKYERSSINSRNVGKWMLFISKDRINAVWDKIKIAIANGDLWSTKVSTSGTDYPTHAIMVYTKDYTDLKDVISVLDYLESSNLKSANETIFYKTDQQTGKGIYSGGIQRSWMYASDTVRGPDALANVDSELHPSEVDKSDRPWLYAKNDSDTDWYMDPELVGKWMLFVPQNIVDETWDKVKTGVKNGHIWSAKVSTTNPRYTSYALMIYTKDYTDLEDVIQVLDYLESSEIKPPLMNIYYKTDEQTRAGVYSGNKQKPWIYSSDTIRNEAKVINAEFQNEADVVIF